MARLYQAVPVILLASWTLLAAFPLPALAQVDPTVRDRILPAAVQIAIMVTSTENGVEEFLYVPVGSGTIIAPDGFILTNHHVVDMAAYRVELDRWEEDARNGGTVLSLELLEDEVLILGSKGSRPPEPLYVARAVEQDIELDLAVLQITSDASGNPVDFTSTPSPYAPLGDSAAIGLGDPIDIFSYPVAGGETLTYTTGVVSGFNFEDGLETPAWITTDATISGGSSGGTAINRRGELIGIPTQGSSLDCRPGDTNLDGTVDVEDVGCIPVGGSIGQLRPINLAEDILRRAGANFVLRTDAGTNLDAPTATSSEAPDDMPTVGAETCERYETVGPCPTEAELANACASGAIFPPGTYLELVRSVSLYRDPTMIPEWGGQSFSLATYDPYGENPLRLEGHTILEISGPFYEMGVCDAWPVRVEISPGDFVDGYVHEWDLRGAMRPTEEPVSLFDFYEQYLD